MSKDLQTMSTERREINPEPVIEFLRECGQVDIQDGTRWLTNGHASEARENAFREGLVKAIADSVADGCLRPSHDACIGGQLSKKE